MFLDACQSVQNLSFLVCACERYLGVCEHYFVGRDRLYWVSVCESFFVFFYQAEMFFDMCESLWCS